MKSMHVPFWGLFGHIHRGRSWALRWSLTIGLVYAKRMWLFYRERSALAPGTFGYRNKLSVNLSAKIIRRPVLKPSDLPGQPGWRKPGPWNHPPGLRARQAAPVLGWQCEVGVTVGSLLGVLRIQWDRCPWVALRRACPVSVSCY